MRCHVLRLRDGGDPVVAADWEPPRPVLQADGSPLQRDPGHPGLSLDMTYAEDAGRSYVIRSQQYVPTASAMPNSGSRRSIPPTRGA